MPRDKTLERADRAGMRDEAVLAKTGRTWEQWVRELDRHGAEQLSHRDVVSMLRHGYELESWWSQMVTVGYERIKGLRARGQKRDGSYEATKSRTFNVPVATLYNAWADANIRRRWLTDMTVRVRTSTASKSIRLGAPDGGIIAVGFVAKGRSKSTVALSEAKLRDRAAAARVRASWHARLDTLGRVLAERAAR